MTGEVKGGRKRVKERVGSKGKRGKYIRKRVREERKKRN